MLVSVTGFGSVWRQRLDKQMSPDNGSRGIAYYNTTGVPIGSRVRQRPQVLGYARFNAAGGFNANFPSRMIHRVFECQPPCVWKGANKLLFERLLPRPEIPKHFLVLVQSPLHGTIDVSSGTWKAETVWVLAMSDGGGQQETLLLMTPGAWVRTQLGLFVVKPIPARPWAAHLELRAGA
jgi:hypothetical protein